MKLNEILEKDEKNFSLNREDIIYLLSLEDKKDIDTLFKKAYEIKLKYVGKKVFFRGLIEFSNICDKNCLYCGIRRENKKVDRFMMSLDEIVAEAKFAYENDYGSVVLQSGERSDKFFIDFVDNAVKEIKRISRGQLGITLCVGEQDEETYLRWFNSGAHRYLLRIETSSPELYRKIHPHDHSFEKRVNAIKTLKKFQLNNIELSFKVGNLFIYAER